MGMHALVIERQEADLDDAILGANLWVAAARPVIKAWFALADIEWDIRHGCDQRTASEAVSILRKPHEHLRRLIDGIRDDFIADNSRRFLTSMTDEEEGEQIAFNDELEARTLSTEGAIKLVGDEG